MEASRSKWIVIIYTEFGIYYVLSYHEETEGINTKIAKKKSKQNKLIVISASYLSLDDTKMMV